MILKKNKLGRSLLLISVSLYLPMQNVLSEEIKKEEFDPLYRSYPDIHDTNDGAPEDWADPVKDSELYTFAQIGRLEYGVNDNNNLNLWDIQGWIGSDHNRFWMKSEGEGPAGDKLESAELQLLYSRPIAAFWDIQAGLRHDFKPGPDRNFGVIGFQGLAPYKFEVDSAFFISDGGDVRWRTELEYDILLTQRLVLQPRWEIVAAFDDVPEYEIRSGLTNSELGLRLRYEFMREFAPYIGISWAKKLGNTADIAEANGESTSTVSFILGIRAWF